ncbi:MAG: class I SAM-dependent RNA methyltransferase [Paracoccaceae bacterium]|nr:class I SAM-dependent RNA methyltransferase [Paracoccaceae bacterium]
MQVTIDRLGHLGDGIAAGPVYVRRTLPGEVIEGALDGGRLTAPRIITPSPDRVSAPCRHYKVCGGCALQHASDEFVRDWKANVVRSALAAVGLDAPIRGVHTSPASSRRRAVFTGRRTKQGAIVGFHAPQSHVVHPVPDCLILAPELQALLPALERLTTLLTSRKGELRIAVNLSDTGADVDLSGGKLIEDHLLAEVAEIAINAGIARISQSGEVVITLEPPVLRIGKTRVPLPAAAFLQATRHGEEALQTSVAAALEERRGKVVDLFAGIGTFALPLAESFEVHAVEGDQVMTEALEAGWRGMSGLKRVTSETRDLFRRPLIPDEFKGVSGIVIDPPRAGAEAQIAEIAKARVPAVSHVSCNPVTFARDAATLVAAGYQLRWIDVVDQFRWSTHIELNACFTLAES